MVPNSRDAVVAEIQRFETAMQTAQETGKRPLLPLDSAPSGWRAVAGAGLHILLVLLTNTALFVRAYRLAAWCANRRIQAIDLWFEPNACGLTSAYLDLGRARVGQHDIEGAIGCLDKAWHVYPCPHSTTYGLPLKLVRLLGDDPRAEKAIGEYREMSRRFRGGS